MSDVGDNNFVRYLYRGEDGEHIPFGTTHITVHKSVTVVREIAFINHPNIVEVVCHDKVEKIERLAFDHCPSLRRLIMPGVTIVGRGAFYCCDALTDVECGKLEIIKHCAFRCCKSLRSINLPSAEVVEERAFADCTALTDVKFGNKLERIKEFLFCNCSLERITIPLKDGMLTSDDIFKGCNNLNYVDLVEGALHETIADLHLEEWRNDMDDEIDSINQILPTCRDDGFDNFNEGERARAIRA